MGKVAQQSKVNWLPARIRSKKPAENEFLYRLALADRIAELPGVHTEEDGGDTLPFRVNVYISGSSSVQRGHSTPALLCTISRDGVALRGLSSADKYRVLSAGWGSLDRDHVNLFLPRDNPEVDTCWEILRRACQNLLTASEKTTLTRITSPWDRPRFSRTTLQ